MYEPRIRTVIVFILRKLNVIRKFACLKLRKQIKLFIPPFLSEVYISDTLKTLSFRQNKTFLNSDIIEIMVGWEKGYLSAYDLRHWHLTLFDKNVRNDKLML